MVLSLLLVEPPVVEYALLRAKKPVLEVGIALMYTPTLDKQVFVVTGYQLISLINEFDIAVVVIASPNPHEMKNTHDIAHIRTNKIPALCNKSNYYTGPGLVK